MTPLIVSAVVFLSTFYFILTEKINRTIVSFVGAVTMVIVGNFFGFYSQDQAIESLDFNTLGLLMGMMIIVSVLKTTGFFSYLAIKTAKLAKGNPWRLMVVMGLVTAFLSMIVDNVTTIVLVVPVTIIMADIMAISPLPSLMTGILLSNIGGIGTMIGDPPNMIIASASGYTFNMFLAKLFPIVLLIMIISLFILRLIFKKDLSRKPRNVKAIMTIDENLALKEVKVVKKCLLSLAVVLILFFLQERLLFSPAFVALLGAGLTFLLVQPDPDKILKEVEWSTLLFFASIFVIVGGVQNSGLISLLASKVSVLAQLNATVGKLTVLWTSAILSPIFGALPFTVSAAPLLKSMAAHGVNIEPLWWMLALGAGLGSNAIPIASAAGVIGMAISKRTRTPITFKSWVATGSIIAVVSVFIVSLFVWMF